MIYIPVAGIHQSHWNYRSEATFLSSRHNMYPGERKLNKPYMYKCYRSRDVFNSLPIDGLSSSWLHHLFMIILFTNPKLLMFTDFNDKLPHPANFLCRSETREPDDNSWFSAESWRTFHACDQASDTGNWSCTRTLDFRRKRLSIWRLRHLRVTQLPNKCSINAHKYDW